MKRYFFLCGCLLALFASSCSDDIMESGTGVENPDRQTESGRILITLPSNVQTKNGVDGEEENHDNLHGTADVNKGHILIFESPAQTGNDYICIKDTVIEFTNIDWSDMKNIPFKLSDEERKIYEDKGLTFWPKAEGDTYNHAQRYTGLAYFKPEKGKYYRIYAYAYHSEGVEPVFTLSNEGSDKPKAISNGKILQNGKNSYTAEQLASIQLAVPKNVTKGKTTEIYGGFILGYEKLSYPISGSPSNTSYIIGDNADQIRNYGGELKRRTGRLEIILSDMTANKVTSASMEVEKYAETEPVGVEKINGDDYNPFEKKRKTVTDEIKPDANGTIRLCADMFYFKDSYVYIKVNYEDGTHQTYQTRSKDTELIPSGPDAIGIYVSKDSKITVPPNFWVTLRGTYEQLVTNGGNLSVEENWGENSEGPELQEQQNQ